MKISPTNKVISKLKEYTSVFFRTKINKEMQERLVNKSPSIICSNCIGGILSHDLGLRFNSPTINLFFTAEDYIKFLENFDYYLTLPLVNFQISERSYPIGILDDIRIHFVHYVNKEECMEKWEKRKRRVNKKNLFIIMTDRNNCSESIVERFSKLKYKKVFFSCRPFPNYDFCVYIPGFEDEGQVGELNRFIDFRGNRFYEKYFDFVKWLNEGSE